MSITYSSFREFYPYYLQEHQNRTCRGCHFVGSWLVLGCLVAALLSGEGRWLLGMPLVGYGFAWTGHFFFEHNKPATFRYPLYSLLGDWVMFWDLLSGKIKL